MLQDPQLGAPAPIDDAITSPVLYILSKLAYNTVSAVLPS
jgi:hypothetical protein